MFCKNCGKSINDTSQFCPYCGTKVKSAIPEESVPDGPVNREDQDNYEQVLDYDDVEATQILSESRDMTGTKNRYSHRQDGPHYSASQNTAQGTAAYGQGGYASGSQPGYENAGAQAGSDQNSYGNAGAQIGYGQNSYGNTGAQAGYGQNSYGNTGAQAGYGQNSYGNTGAQAGYGQNSYGNAGAQAGYGQNSYGNTGAQAGYGQNGYGNAGAQAGYGQNGYGNAGAQAGYGQNSYGNAGAQAGYGQNSYGNTGAQAGYGQNGYGSAGAQPGYGQGGYAAGGQAPGRTASGAGNLKPKKKLGKGAIIGICVGGGVALIAIIVVVCVLLLGRRSTYETPLATLVDAVNDGDVMEILDVVPLKPIIDGGELSDYLMGMDYDDLVSLYEGQLEDAMIDEFRDEFGWDFEVDYKINYTYEYSAGELSELNSDYSYSFGTGDDFIEEAMDLDVDLMIKGSGEYETDNETITVIKVDGKWYLDMFSLG